MSQTNPKTPAKNSSTDWFVRGILTRLGEMLDQFTGRNWKPSSSLATSQLIERLKTLLDDEARDLGEKGKVVPHHIKLKIQWDKFSADVEDSLKKLETELLAAAIDHINDRRYQTFAPMQFEVKTDYFTEGVKLSASFDGFAENREVEPEEVNVTVPDLKNIVVSEPEAEIVEPEKEVFIFSFVVKNQPKQINLAFLPKERKSVGRTKENDLWIDDASVSKLHASLVFNGENQLVVADTGSTNGTFVNNLRIAYGKAIVLNDTEKLTFGTVDVEFQRVAKDVGEDQFTAKLSAEKNIPATRKFSAVEGVRQPNEFATNADYSTNHNFSTNKISADEQNSSEESPSFKTMKEIPPTRNFVKEIPPTRNFVKATTPVDEKKIVADFENTPDKKTKDEL